MPPYSSSFSLLDSCNCSQPLVWFCSSADPRDDFHTYAMEWNSSLLTWWVDGGLVKQLPAAPHFDAGHPMDLALSFGVRPPLNREHGGQPNAMGFPTTFWVDWVRVWQRE